MTLYPYLNSPEPYDFTLFSLKKKKKIAYNIVDGEGESDEWIGETYNFIHYIAGNLVRLNSVDSVAVVNHRAHSAVVRFSYRVL